MTTRQTDAPSLDAEVQPHRIRGSLKRSLLLWFMATSLLPLTLFIAVSYYWSKENLRAAALRSITAKTEERAAFIDNWFHYRYIDLDVQATSVGNFQFLSKLRDALHSSEKNIGGFVKSFRWETIVEEHASDLRTFRKMYDYHDVFLIDSDGNILFTIAEKDDLGTNIFDGPGLSTGFAKACRKSLDTGRLAFSDLERYAPSENIAAGFLTSVVVDEEGERIGVLAVQIGNDVIEAAMTHNLSNMRDGIAYLVGTSPEAGVTLRSTLVDTDSSAEHTTQEPGSSFGESAYFLDQRVDTEQTRLWQAAQILDSKEAAGVSSEAFIYTGPQGEQVLGVCKDIMVCDVKWGLISEIAVSQAFAPVRQLGNLVLTLAFFTSAIVFVTANIVTRRIVRPIKRLSDVAKLVAAGDLEQTIENGNGNGNGNGNEIGELARSFDQMVDGLREAAGLKAREDWFKTGQVGLGKQLRGEREVAPLARNIVTYLTKCFGAQVGAFYVPDQKQRLKLVGSYAFQSRLNLANEFNIGEGLVGQAAMDGEQILLTNVPDDYIAVSSGLGDTPLRNILVWPIVHDDKVKGVIEMGSLEPFEDHCLELLNQVRVSISMALDGAQANWRQHQQSEELQTTVLELAESESRTRSILESAADAIVAINEQGSIELFNPAAERIFGYSSSEVMKKNVNMLMPSPYHEQHDGYLAKYLRTGERFIIGSSREVTGRRKDGTEFPIDLSVSESIAGDNRQFIGMVRDITDRKQVEETLRDSNKQLEAQTSKLLASEESLQQQSEKMQTTVLELAESESRTRSILESAADAIVAINEQGSIELFNPAAERIFGYSASEVIEKNVNMLMPSPYHEQHDGYLAKYLRTGERFIIGSSREVTGRRKDGTEFPIDLSVSESIAGDNRQFIGMVRDITDRKQVEETLRDSNKQLEAQTSKLLASEESLQQQSEKMHVVNEELWQKTESLQLQNEQIERSKGLLEENAEELILANKYKSEFLANMSHELRTPLNSLLILAKSLADNEEGNLTSAQVEAADVIHGGGRELLLLINEILDLSKVEAGKMEAHYEQVNLRALADRVQSQLTPLAEKKGLSIKVELAEGLCETLVTDGQKVEQILRNLMANALKFTETGSITLRMAHPKPGTQFRNSNLTLETAIAISVIDTGIGIPKDKHEAIFGSFQQADGSTSRQYGGTGLGLAISGEFATLLGGEIILESCIGEGSNFTLCLPLEPARAETAKTEQIPASPGPVREVGLTGHVPDEITDEIRDGSTTSEVVPTQEFLPNDHIEQSPGDKTILIVEGDKQVAQMLSDLCHEREFKCVVAETGSDALRMSIECQPSGILLDLELPDLHGMLVLDELKRNLATRHIPVHIISGGEKTVEALTKGAIGVLDKPVDSADVTKSLDAIAKLLESDSKRVLMIEDNESIRRLITKNVQFKNVEITETASGEKGYQMLLDGNYDCAILDLESAKLDAFELFNRIDEQSISMPPIIVYSEQDVEATEREHLESLGCCVVTNGPAFSALLTDKVSLFLHSNESSLSADQIRTIQGLHSPTARLRDKKVLVVDDDMRNTFALSKVLEAAGMNVVLADNGQIALDVLQRQNDIDLVLMDIMMPIMDGYEATRQIRRDKRTAELPVIALTAKAMPEDRAKCLDAGASDYMTKPVDVERLLTLIDVWIHNRRHSERVTNDRDSKTGLSTERSEQKA